MNSYKVYYKVWKWLGRVWPDQVIHGVLLGNYLYLNRMLLRQYWVIHVIGILALFGGERERNILS